MIKGISMKGQRIIISFILQSQMLEQLHSNNMDIKKATHLASKSVYWINMNADINSTIKQCATCLECQQTQPQEKTILYQLSCKLWEVVAADIFVKYRTHLCIVDYCSWFPIVKKAGTLAADDLVKTAK